MEKLLFKKGRKGFRRDFIAALNPSLFRYAPLHKEGFNNSKQYLGLKKMCKFESGLISNKCKLFLGRVRAVNYGAAYQSELRTELVPHAFSLVYCHLEC